MFTYQSLLKATEGNYHESGSKFIAYSFPVTQREELEVRLAEIKALHPKARHHCYAYRLLEREEITEYANDAGEPSGSAGQPILGELRRNGLVNIVVIVVRYFGGTKLGIPGLIHAYRESASQSIHTNQIITVVRTVTFIADTPLALQPKFYAACKQCTIEIEEPAYTDRFHAFIKVPLENAEETVRRLVSLIAGQDGEIEALSEWLELNLKKMGDG